MSSETQSAGQLQPSLDDKNPAAEHKVPEEGQDKTVTEEEEVIQKEEVKPIDADEPPPKPGFIPRGSTSYPVSGGAGRPKPGPIKR